MVMIILTVNLHVGVWVVFRVTRAGVPKSAVLSRPGTLPSLRL